MESWIEFGRGPLFRLSIALMLLGLARILVLTILGIVEAYRRSQDKIINWREVRRQTVGWLVPAQRLGRKRPLYSTASLLFHVGLLTVPLFLAAHVALWKRGIGFGWAAVPQQVANWASLVVILCGLALVAGRYFDRGARAMSGVQEYAWPLLIVLPFLTGYLCANAPLRPATYDALMFVHVYVADLILIAIPFTKIAHCVLAPLSQVVTAVAWKFPAGAGDRVAAALGYSDRPVWVDRARAPRVMMASTQEVAKK